MARRRDNRTADAPEVHVRIGRLVVDAGAVDAAGLDGAIRAALAQRFAAEPALHGVAQPVSEAIAGQVTLAHARSPAGVEP